MKIPGSGRPVEGWGPWFKARFDSWCAECGDVIGEDDHARYEPGGCVVCEQCGLEGDDE